MLIESFAPRKSSGTTGSALSSAATIPSQSPGAATRAWSHSTFALTARPKRPSV